MHRVSLKKGVQLIVVMIFGLIWCLYFIVGNSWGACTPGVWNSSYNMPNGATGLPVNTSWLPSRASTCAANYWSGCGGIGKEAGLAPISTYEYNWQCQDGWVQCVWNGNFNEVRFHKCSGADSCGTGYDCEYIMRFNGSVCGNAGGDFDCDGLPDTTDPDPGHPVVDTDNDGVPDDNDPWPNNALLPGSGEIMKMVYKHKTLDATFTFYGNVDCVAAGGVGFGVGAKDDCIAASCTGSDCGSVMNGGQPDDKPGDYNYYDHGSGSWDDWFPNGGGDDNSPPGYDPEDATSGELGGILGELKDISSKAGSEVLELQGISDSLNSGNLGGGIKGSVDGLGTTLGGKLDQIKTAIEGQGQVSMAGVETRIDSTNAKIDSTNTKLDALNTKTVPMGDGSLPDADLGSVQDNSSVSDSENTDRLSSEAGSLTSFLDDFWNGNPIRTMVEGSGVTTSGSSSFVLDAGFGSTTVDLSGLSGSLETLGTILLGLSTLGGLIVVLRGH